MISQYKKNTAEVQDNGNLSNLCQVLISVGLFHRTDLAINACHLKRLVHDLQIYGTIQ